MEYNIKVSYIRNKCPNNPKWHSKAYCKVCDEWLTYSNFEKWFNKNYKEGQQLDKDILFEGNKLYSPETCCFVPSDINTMMITRQTKKSCLPTGVSEVKSGKYQAVSGRYRIARRCYYRE